MMVLKDGFIEISLNCGGRACIHIDRIIAVKRCHAEDTLDYNMCIEHGDGYIRTYMLAEGEYEQIVIELGV